jgi:hypothetical protein
MRKHVTCLVALAFLLFVVGATAQTSSSGQSQPSTTTTTTTTTQQANPGSSDQTQDQRSGMSHAKTSSQTSGAEQTVEGCIVKESSDYFLIPSHGNPIELQASSGQDLSAHAGHKVKVHGTESSLGASSSMGAGGTGGAAGTAATSTTTTTESGAQSSTRSSVSEPAGSSGSSQAGEASGTGNNLHRLATKEMTVVKLDHVAVTCPVNWNPRVSSKGSSKY